MMDEDRRRLAIDKLAGALEQDAKNVTVERSDDGFGVRVDWQGSRRALVIRTKIVRTGDGPELRYVESPGGYTIADVDDVKGAVMIVRDLSGELAPVPVTAR